MSKLTITARGAVRLTAMLIACFAGAAAGAGSVAAGGALVVSTTIGRDGTAMTTVATARAGATAVRNAHHPTRVLVKFRDGMRQDVLPGSGPVQRFRGDPDLALVEAPLGLSAREAARRYRERGDVLYAETDSILRALDTQPSDPRFAEQWDMAKIACPAAWDEQTDASDVVVAVVDTGIDLSHPDLRANLWTAADGTHGFTCIGGSCIPGGADDFGHGTHVAGTIGAEGNNGIGIAGINWRVRLLPMKFLDAGGSGYASDAILCFDMLAELKRQGVNVRVTNNSWGGEEFSQSLKDAMERLEASGIVNVCAAGNSGSDTAFQSLYPAAFDDRGIVSVLAVDINDVAASFTNYGLADVDIAAPGVSTLSTVPSGSCALCDPSGYKLLSGTSMATPHVSGALAALLHRFPALSAIEARDVVLDPRSWDALADPFAKLTSTGGRLNVRKTLDNPLAASPRPNHYPSLVPSGDVTVSAGEPTTLVAVAADADGDALRTVWSRPIFGPHGSEGAAWTLGTMVDRLLPFGATGSALSLTAPSLAESLTVPYSVAAADGRGGSAKRTALINVNASPSPGTPPSGTLTVTPLDGPPGTFVTARFPAFDPDLTPVRWDLWFDGAGYGGIEATSFQVELTWPGVYRFHAQAFDSQLQVSPRSNDVLVRIGGATGEPPIASLAIDRTHGSVPLTVAFDASASRDPDGAIEHYGVYCGGHDGFADYLEPRGACTYTEPGLYWLRVYVSDDHGNYDIDTRYVVATLASVERRGDANGDGVLDIGDVFYMINFIFAGGPSPPTTLQGDANGDGVLDISDVFSLINSIFSVS